MGQGEFEFMSPFKAPLRTYKIYSDAYIQKHVESTIKYHLMARHMQKCGCAPTSEEYKADFYRIVTSLRLRLNAYDLDSEYEERRWREWFDIEETDSGRAVT